MLALAVFIALTVLTHHTAASSLLQAEVLSRAASFNVSSGPYVIEIWGPDAGHFWTYDLNQPVIKRYAKTTIDNVTLVCRTGGPTSPELDFARYVILVISAQSWDTRKIAASWLKEVRSLKNLVSLGIVLKGSERCTNDWLLPYLKDQTVFRIRFMFTIYGYSYGYGKGIGFPQDRLFLWPLGVAAIRGFPKATLRPVLAEPEGAKRKYLCNFLGTLHSHALARKQVVRILRDPRHKHWKCFLKYRDEWTKSESHQSMAQYVDTLKNTDFTLCPAGNNVESFRIYEAMSFGSVPVLLHDVVIKKGDLQDSTYKCTGAFELLKFHSAPVIWLNSWSELPAVMENLLAETPAETYQRRLSIIEWYRRFSEDMVHQFVHSTSFLLEQ